VSRARRIVGCLVALSAVVAPPTAGAAVPKPHVVGPLPVTAKSYPFGAADHQEVPQDLRRHGYVEEEYLVSGKANVYDWPAPGPAVVRTADAPYTTRILVRRPARRSRFSGNVVVELLNPSNLFDLNIGWGLAHRQFLRNGDAWVGITAKPISVVALKMFDPKRYGSLSFANPLPLSDPRNCTDIQTWVDPPDLRSRHTEDGLAWDIYSQVGAWVRGRSSPFKGATDRVYGFGYSQTGGYLYTYVNGIHPLATAANGGRPVYDAYLVAVAGGPFVGLVHINQCWTLPPPTDPRWQFTNVGVPIIHVMSQSDYLSGISARRPDSDVRDDRFRHYEMAGAGHATPDELYYSAASEDILRAGRDVPPDSCNEGPRSRFPSSIHFDAMFRNLDLWVRYGIAPPRAAPIEVVNGAPVLDEFGNVRGGLRSPFVDVPTATWNGSSTGESFCFIAGHEVPFDAARLRELYPTHRTYVRKVVRNVAQLIGQRFLTLPDGIELVQEAARADVP
jgi:Alpha/beta hydrolase domain